MRTTFLFAFLTLASVAYAQNWTDSVNINIRTSLANPEAVNNTRFRIWLPESPQGLKSILLVSARGVGFNNGADGSGIYGRGESFKFAFNPYIRRVASKRSMAILCIQGQNDGGIVTDFNPELGHADSLLKAIHLLATRTQKPELNFVPFISFGHSLGAIFSEYIALWNPDRVAGAIVYQTNGGISAPSWVSPFNPPMSLVKVPVLMTNGELEGPDINNNSVPFFAANSFTKALALRQAGVPVHPIFMRSGSHSTILPPEAKMMARFIEEVIDARIPISTVPATSPVVLYTLDQTEGVLGALSGYNTFDPAISAFSQGAAPNRFWLFNNDYAQQWFNFHNPKVRLNLSQSGPFCVGDTFTVNYQITPFNEGNETSVVRLEMSSIRGDFDSYSFNTRILGSKLRRSNQDFTGSFVAKIPDNIQRVQTIANGSPQRYRFRLVHTNPVEVSAASAEVPISFCGNPEFNLFTYVQNGGVPVQFCQNSRDSIPLVIARNAAFTLNAGNQLDIQLSDSAGSFANPILLKQVVSQISGGGTSPSVVVNVALPVGLPVGLGYRLRAVSSNPASTSSTNGSDIRVFVPSDLLSSILPNQSYFHAPFAQRYQWYKNGAPLVGEVFQMLTSTDGLNFRMDSVSCISWNGTCSQQAIMPLLVSNQQSLNVPAEFSAYPNPNTGEFQIKGIEKMEQLFVMDALGKKIEIEHVENFTYKLPNCAPNGLYVLSGQKDGQWLLFRIMKVAN